MHCFEAIKKYEPVNTQERSDQQILLDYIKNNAHTVLTRNDQVAHLTSSAIVVNEGKDKMLMIHHNIYNTWTWVGGHLDGHENAYEVALKEAKEETGLEELTPHNNCENIQSLEILPVNAHFKNGQYVSSHLHLNVTYIFIADEKAPIKVNQDETSGIKWVPIIDVPKYSNEPVLIKIYEKLFRRLV